MKAKKSLQLRVKRWEGGVCKKMISDDSGGGGGLPKMMDDYDGLKRGVIIGYL